MNLLPIPIPLPPATAAHNHNATPNVTLHSRQASTHTFNSRKRLPNRAHEGIHVHLPRHLQLHLHLRMQPGDHLLQFNCSPQLGALTPARLHPHPLQRLPSPPAYLPAPACPPGAPSSHHRGTRARCQSRACACQRHRKAQNRQQLLCAHAIASHSVSPGTGRRSSPLV